MSYSPGSHISRRRFAELWSTSLVASLSTAHLLADQEDDSIETLPTLKMAAHFLAASYLAASPDGKRICIFVTDNPVQSFAFDSGRWTKKQADTSRDSLHIIDVTSGKSIFQRKSRHLVFPASFFADGDRIYAETLSFRQGDRAVDERFIVDLSDGTVFSEVGPRPRGIGFGHFALWGDTLLATGTDPAAQEREVTLLQVGWRDHAIRLTAPYTTVAREKRPKEFPRYLSADRKTVVYGIDHLIICRRTTDLGVLWTTEVDSIYLGAPRINVSADGTYVVAAVTDNLFSDQEKLSYVALYDGKTGRELRRFAVSGTNGVAVSPDGALIAAAHVFESKEGSIPTVILIDASTGKKVARVTHGVARLSAFLNAFEIHGVEFTSDGRYLITATGDTIVWDLSVLRTSK